MTEPVPEDVGPRWTRSAHVLLSILAYLALSFFWLLPSSKTPGSMIADLGDPLHLAYLLAWDAHAFATSPSQLFETNSFYPAHQTLAFSEHLIPEAILVAPVFWLTGNAVLTYNVCVMLGLVMSALAMFFLIRELTGHDGAAFLGGVAYSFTGFSLMEIARVQVIHMQWWPLALLFLGRFVARRTFKDALAFGLLLAWQGLSCSYYLIFTILVAPFWLIALYASSHRLPSMGEILRLAGAALISGALVLAVIHPYLGRVGDDADSKVSAGVDLREFLTPGQASVLGDDASRDEPVASYAREYIGLSTAVLALVGVIFGLRKPLRPEARGFVWLALITFLMGVFLAMGRRMNVWNVDVGPGPLDLILRVFTMGTRHVPRFVALTKVGLAILTGFGAAAMAKGMARWAWRMVFVVFALLLPLEHWQPVQALYGSTLPVGDAVPPVYPALATMGKGPVVEIPLPSRKRLWALQQYFSTYHWRPIPYGRTRYYPPWLDYLTEGILDFPNARSLDALQIMGLETVLIQPYAWPESEREKRMAEVEASPRLRFVKSFPNPKSEWRELREARVYALVPVLLAEPCRLEGELPRTGWHPSSRVGRGAEYVITDELDTYWTTERLQKGGDNFRVTFDKPVEMAAVSMQMGNRPSDFPNYFMLELRRPDGEWHRVVPVDPDAEARRTLSGLLKDPKSARHVIRFEPEIATGLRITLTWAGEYPTPWSMLFLRAYAGCTPVPSAPVVATP